MRFLFTVTSGSHYPLKTEGEFDSGSWTKAARLAEKAHRDNLRKQKKLRKHGNEVLIKLIRAG